MIVAAQIRAARGLLGINQSELASWQTSELQSSSVSSWRVKFSGWARTIWKLQTALEKAGRCFHSGGSGGGPGVRLREAPSGKSKRRRSR